MNKLRMTLKSSVEREVIKNLLSAQKRIAEQGTAWELIRLTRFLLRLTKECGDVLVDAITESNNERCSDPVEEL